MFKKILLVDENITGYFIVFSIISIIFSLIVYVLSQTNAFGNPNKLTLIEMSKEMDERVQKRKCDVSVGVKLSDANTKDVCL